MQHDPSPNTHAPRRTAQGLRQALLLLLAATALVTFGACGDSTDATGVTIDENNGTTSGTNNGTSNSGTSNSGTSGTTGTNTTGTTGTNNSGTTGTNSGTTGTTGTTGTNNNTTPTAQEVCEAQCADLVERCSEAFGEVCPPEVVGGLGDACIAACETPEGQGQIGAASQLACDVVVPLAIDGFGLADICVPPAEDEICDDGIDNDDDGLTDCADIDDCADAPECQPEDEICDDAIDNDGDGDIDCDDTDCADFADCIADEICDDAIDNDGDGDTDCDDADCADALECQPEPEVCDDGLDNDGDGDADCDDADCDDFADCLPTPELCDNGQDDDGDGDADCDDDDCAQAPNCQPTPELCQDGIDNDGDGAIDCFDPDCMMDPACQQNGEICNDGQDNDLDGFTDCADPDCAQAPNCQQGEICNDGQDNDGDGLIDCADQDCSPAPNCQPGAEICDDRVDNDQDGFTDCDDPDCAQAPACVGQPEICDNGADDDRDGDIDCADDDCANFPACAVQPEICDDFIDNDQDGLFDCLDPDCAQAPACQTEICDDGIDNNQDGNTDCDDVACFGEPRCQPEFICNDGVDNDEDGLTDCADDDCAFDLNCAQPEICDDFIDNDQDGLIDCFDIDCAQDPACIDADPTCRAPEVITGPGTYTGTTDGLADNHLGSCTNPQSVAPEAVWVFPASPIAAGIVCVDTIGSDIDTVLYARSGDCELGDEVACNDDIDVVAGNFQSRFELRIDGNTDYFLFVDGFDASGDYTFNINLGPCDTTEVCDNGTDDDGDGLTDCLDLDCAQDPACIAGVEICDDGLDNDRDGATDCDDADCAQAPNCQGGGPLTCANPEVILQPGVIRGTTRGLGLNETATCGQGTANSPEAVYAVRTPAFPGALPFCISTEGSDFDTVLSVRQDACDLASELDCNDDVTFGVPTSQIDLLAEGDTTYFIIVDGYDGAAGEYALSFTQGACDGSGEPEVCDDGADNDRDGLADCDDPDCALDPFCIVGGPEICTDGIDNDRDGAIDCDDTDCQGTLECYFADETCAAPNIITQFGTVTGTTAGLPSVNAGSCGSSGASPEAVWAFSVDAGATVCLDTRGSGYDTVLYVRRGDDTFPNEAQCLNRNGQIICNDDSADAAPASQVEINAAADTWYYVFVDGFNGAQGDYNLSVIPGPCASIDEICDNGIDDNGSGLVDCADPACAQDPACVQADLTCDAPFIITELGGLSSSTEGLPSNFGGSCAPTSALSSEAVFAITIADDEPAPIPLCLSTSGSAFDTVLYAREADCATGAELDCNDDIDGNTLQSAIDIVARPGGTYFVFVDGFNGAAGDFILDTQIGPCDAIAAEICTDRIDNDGDGLIDCADPSCAADPACLIGNREICDDGIDNDGDGRADCADDECFDFCNGVEVCNDGIDNDNDGLFDCDDILDCFDFPGCQPENCGNGIDDDGNGLTDCADPVCAPLPECAGGQELTCANPGLIRGEGQVSGQLSTQPNEHSGSCQDPGFPDAGEAVYALAVPQATPVCLTTGPAAQLDTILYVREASCARGAEVSCNDDIDLANGLAHSQLEFDAAPGVTYYVFVDGYEGFADDYTLDIEFNPCF